MKPSRKLRRVLAGVLCALLATAVLAGCSGAPTLQGGDRDAVLSYAEPIADNLLQGMNGADYAAFSRDFNSQMQTAIPAGTFSSSIVTNIAGKLGHYLSRQVSSVSQMGGNILVIYTAKFEKDDNVTIRLSLEQTAPHHVSGLYFNSAILSQK